MFSVFYQSFHTFKLPFPFCVVIVLKTQKTKQNKTPPPLIVLFFTTGISKNSNISIRVIIVRNFHLMSLTKFLYKEMQASNCHLFLFLQFLRIQLSKTEYDLLYDIPDYGKPAEAIKQIFELQLKIKIERKEPSLNEQKLYRTGNCSHFPWNEVRNSLEIVVKIIKLTYSGFSYQLKPLLFFIWRPQVIFTKWAHAVSVC